MFAAPGAGHVIRRAPPGHSAADPGSSVVAVAAPPAAAALTGEGERSSITPGGSTATDAAVHADDADAKNKAATSYTAPVRVSEIQLVQLIFPCLR